MMPNSGTIVVVEDSEEDFSMIMEGIRQFGIKTEVIRMTNVLETLEFVKSNKEISLMLLDLNLPGGSGHQILKAYKSDIHKRSTPVIVLSTSDNFKDIKLCYELGANSYHVKPLETPSFYKLVREIMSYWIEKTALVGFAR